jgi:hypothetical protein
MVECSRHITGATDRHRCFRRDGLRRRRRDGRQSDRCDCKRPAASTGVWHRLFGRRWRTPSNPTARAIASLDSYPVGWELIDHTRYSYWGGKRAVVMQFSSGCRHLCNYGGQRGCWTRWRHRDPVLFAREIARGGDTDAPEGADPYPLHRDPGQRNSMR